MGEVSGNNGGTKSLPLHSYQVDPYIHFFRAYTVIYACAFLALFYHHFHCIRNSNTFLSFSISLTLLIADAVLAFIWFLSQASRWRPVYRQVFLERLASRVNRKDFPGLDVFMFTADPLKEPPMVGVNTALSVMAYDYPTDKLSIYISDDGGSELTLFTFMEMARFAKHWIPFCRENGVEQRSPEAYFQSNAGGSHCEEIQLLYERMKRKVESVVERGRVDDELLLLSDEERQAFSKWTTGFSPQEHPAVVQVLLESSKDVDTTNYPLPNLVYVSREKNRAVFHHFKAGAINALLKVSSIMSNAPIVLTLDCDMASNNPKTPQEVLCYMLDEDLAGKLGFVQYAARFNGINRDDIYSSDMKIIEVFLRGMDGVRGPAYDGSGTFFSRRALHSDNQPFSMQANGPIKSEQVLKRAHEVAGCTYEHGTDWGYTMGIRYGPLAEDYFTGFSLLSEGWRSVFCNPQRPAFLGEAPISLNDTLSQIRRWCVGLLELAFSEYCPLIYGTKNVSLLFGMGFAHFALIALLCIPMVIYGILPQIALLYQLPIFPKAFDRWFYLYSFLFLGAYARHLVEFLRAGGTVRRWWNDQRMWTVHAVTCLRFGFIEFLLERFDILPGKGFVITSKLRDNEQDQRYEKGIFEFGVSSPFFVSLTTFAIISFTSLVVGLPRALIEGTIGNLAVQLFLSAFVVVNCWPIYDAMVFRKDAGRIPSKCILISLFLTGAIHIIAYPMYLGLETT